MSILPPFQFVVASRSPTWFNHPVNITNLNPDADIGASAWLVEIDDHRILLDAGMHPKREGREGLPMFGKAGNAEVDAIAISHCHHDHVGALPVACRHFPKAHVLMSELSYFIVERVLHNSVNVMMRQRDELGIREYPLYTHDEVDDLAPQFQGFKYNREIEWAAFHKTRAGRPSPTLEFFDAGHTLGSAGILIRGKRETLFYTGDVCFHDQTILRSGAVRGREGRRDDHGNHARQSRRAAGFFARDGNRTAGGGDSQRAQAQGLRADSVLRPGPHAGDAGAAGVADARRKIEGTADLYRRAGPGVHGNLRSGGAPDPPTAHEFATARGVATHRARKGPGGKNETQRRAVFLSLPPA